MFKSNPLHPRIPIIERSRDAFEERPRCSQVSGCSKRRDAPTSRIANAPLVSSHIVRMLLQNPQLWTFQSASRSPRCRRRSNSPPLPPLPFGPKLFPQSGPLPRHRPHMGLPPSNLRGRSRKWVLPRNLVPSPPQPSHL